MAGDGLHERGDVPEERGEDEVLKMPGRLADRAAVITYFKEKVPKFLDTFERLLPADGPAYFAGSELSYADIAVYETLDRHLLLCPVLAQRP